MDSRLLRYWIGFNRAKGIGPLRQRALMDYFGDIERAWNAPAEKLRAAGLDQRSLRSLLTTRARCNLDAELKAIEQSGIHVITLDDPDYPPLLRQIPDPPALLYVKGTLLESDWRAIAVVGTRRATVYGKTMTREIVEPLAAQGIVIVSGLARGIDAAAHQAALDVGGRTLAVLANGLDRIYPPEHRQLAEHIAANGALISELPLGEPPESSHFAPRNRIVSGLTWGTLVVEATEHSGTLLTVNQALEQGREVFAVPGNALSPASKGTNTLIQGGAKMVTSAEDILEELETVLQLRDSHSLDRKPSPVSLVARPVALPQHDHNEMETAILASLSLEPYSVDDLSIHLKCPVGQVASALTILELHGYVQQISPMHYALTDTSTH